jgi:hypothetical protein
MAVGNELAGVTMPRTLSVAGKTLTLNGVGLRKKSLVKVYVSGLYLSSPCRDASAILAADSPRAVRMHFLREVTKNQLVDSLVEGFQNNASEMAIVQRPNIDRLMGMLPEVREGTTITFFYVPGTGLSISKGDQVVGTIESKELADVVFALWLGPKPPSDDIKQGMLGI